MSGNREEIGYTKPESAPAQSELFGEIAGAPGDRIKYPEKLAELEREIKHRRRLYPRLVSDGKLTKERAERQLAVLESIIDDYNVRPWPQTRAFVGEWREDAERVTFMEIPIRRMHREELMAVVAYAKAALELTKGED